MSFYSLSYSIYDKISQGSYVFLQVRGLGTHGGISSNTKEPRSELRGEQCQGEVGGHSERDVQSARTEGTKNILNPV
jgi:hypothetical protein